MHILKNNPFLLKFFTSIEGYLHIFLSPILIFYLTKDIKLSGLFFLIDNMAKFTTYSLSGSILTSETINSIIKYSYFFRFIFVLSALLIFYFVEENQFTLLVINNIGFTVCNAFYSTSIETLFQNHHLFNKDVQSKITAGDLWSGGFSVLLILIFTFYKIPFYWLIPVVLISFFSGLVVLHRLVEALTKLKKIELNRLFKNGVKEFAETIKFISSSKEMLENMMIGYVPFAFFLIVEQFNIFRFGDLYEDQAMKILHYSFKCTWFVSGAILIPWLVRKSREINQIFELGIVAFVLGGTFSLIPGVTAINLLGALLLGYSQSLIFVYRKINRRRILDNAQMGFQSLGVFFAIEGLSGVIANTYLAVFGSNYLALSLTFLGSNIYLIFKNKNIQEQFKQNGFKEHLDG